MFDLQPECLQGLILGCGDGPASFNAEMTTAGSLVVSIDPIYEFSGAEIRQRFEETVDWVIAQVKATPQDWTWTFHRNPEDLRQNRTRALELFLADYEVGLAEDRYRIGALPELSFEDGAFDLALCSHLLFLYSDLLSAVFHERAVWELCRVAHEVRIFPLLTLDLRRSPYIDPVRDALAARGIHSEIQTVEYEFQKGGNQMLRLFRT